MTSIYTDNFGKNLSRVYARSEQKNEIGSVTSKKETSFENLLEDVENKASFTPPIAADTTEEAPKAPLSNLKPSEILPQKINVPASKEPYIIGDIPIDEDESSVNINLLTDKLTTPEGISPTVPTIVSSRRYALPQGRELASIVLDKKEIKDIIITAGKYHGIDPSLGLAVAQAESSLRPDAVSSDGFASKGVFQLLDSTAADMRELTGIQEAYKPFDPSMNSFLGMAYLRRLHNIFSQDTSLSRQTSTVAAKTAADLEKIAVAAYNAGEGNVARAQAKAKSLGKDPSVYNAIEPHLPAITRGYVKKVTELRAELSPLLTNKATA